MVSGGFISSIIATGRSAISKSCLFKQDSPNQKRLYQADKILQSVVLLYDKTMVKLLPLAFAVVLMVGVLIYFRFFNMPQSNPQQPVQSVGKTTNGGNERITALELTVANLMKQIGGSTPTPT